VRQVRRQACGRAAELERNAGHADEAEIRLDHQWGGRLMTKKAKHKDKKQESKKDRARDIDDRATPRDDDRERTVPDDQKHE
jgi:hypothetical protein